MKLYIVRHGQTNSNVSNKLLGITDEDINENGVLQILKLRKKLDKEKIDICFSSPLKRTRHTASIICNDNVPIVVDERLLERDFGILEGGKDYRYTPDFWDLKLNKKDYGVELLNDLFSRANDFIEFLKTNYKDKNILIVSHAATIRAMHFNIVGFSENTDMLSFKVDNGCVLEYVIKE